MADKPKKIIPDADYKRLMPKFRAHVISESAAKRLGLSNKPTPKAEKPASKPKAPPEVKKPVEPKAKSSALKKKVVDNAPITISKGKRGATKWRKGNGPWRYDEPPAQHKPKVIESPKETKPVESKVVAGSVYDHGAHQSAMKRAKVRDWKKRAAATREAIVAGGSDPTLGEVAHERHVRHYTAGGDEIVNGWLRHNVKSGRADQVPEWHEKRRELDYAVDCARWDMAARGYKWDFKNPPQIREVKELEAHEKTAATTADFSGVAKRLIAGIDSFIAARTLKVNVTTFRGASMSEAAFGSLAKGATFTDAGYVSTSLNKSMATTFAKKKDGNNVRVLFEIHASRGSHAAYIEEHSKNDGEHEILLPRGSRFKVLRVEIPPGGVGLHKISVALV